MVERKGTRQRVSCALIEKLQGRDFTFESIDCVCMHVTFNIYSFNVKINVNIEHKMAIMSKYIKSVDDDVEISNENKEYLYTICTNRTLSFISFTHHVF